MNRLAWNLGWWLALCVLMPWEGWGAIPQASAIKTVRSTSRQFIIHGVPLENKGLSPEAHPTDAPIRIDPALLAVSCERIKAAFLTQLGLRDSWKGKIHLFIRFSRLNQKPIDIYPVYYQEGWQYQIALPDEVDPTQLARAMVQVLLLELANRRSGPRLSEVPLWLSEGLLHHLKAVSGRNLVLQPFSRITRQEARHTPWDEIKGHLQNRTPLTFNQLSMPTPDYLKGDSWEAYQASAHLLVNELLKLPQGRLSMVVFLQQLPAVLNWQTSFLAAFRNHFPRLLEVEKWWAITLVNFQHGEKLHGWSVEATMEKLDEILNLAVQIRQQPQDLPTPSRMSLQRILEQWDYQVQADLVRAKIQQLALLHLYSAPPLAPLVALYRDTLARYLDERNRAGVEPELKGRPIISAPLVLRQTIQRLDELDKQRQFAHNQIAGQKP